MILRLTQINLKFNTQKELRLTMKISVFSGIIINRDILHKQQLPKGNFQLDN